MNISELIDGVLQREGQGSPPYDDPYDHGDRTSWGISERAHPDAWTHGPPSRDEAARIYRQQYVVPFAALMERGVDPRLVVALVDDAVLSGVRTATTTVQRVLGVTVDGVIGPATIAAAEACDGQWLLVRLVQARAHRLARLVEQDHSQARFIVGWVDRALSVLG